MEKGELPWSDLRFQSKTQSNQLSDAWCLKVMGFRGDTKILYQAGVKCHDLLETIVLDEEPQES